MSPVHSRCFSCLRTRNPTFFNWLRQVLNESRVLGQRVFYRSRHIATAGAQRGHHREFCFGRMSRWCSNSLLRVLVSFRDLLSRILLGNRSRSTHEERSRDSIARREISMTAPISPATVDSMPFQRECRRAFSGHESVIHCRRTSGGIQSKAQ
jgi:hypothetical protein